MTAETREQAEDAVRVLDAVIARDRACEAFHAYCRSDGSRMGDEWRRLRMAQLDADDHALDQMEIYKARYGATR